MYVIATAGHVDHGKSTLISALTGMEPDRWAEEQRRGMTIDLGYAWTELDGDTVAFVDVPGHRKFLSNTLAGMGPVPAVLLVVASDEGWGRQTAEHVAALDALGVRHGVLALTRSDLGFPELAESEARDHLAGTSLAGIEAVAVSAVTGDGIPELRTALRRLTSALPSPPEQPTRLWVDRSFSVRGAGTIVTGTLATGTLRVGDDVEVVPSGQRVQVRGIETLKTSVGQANAVARVALNLRGVKPAEVPRGSALVAPGQWAVASTIDVRLSVDRVPEQALLHLGSAAVPVRVRPLVPGIARLSLAKAVPVRTGERALLRDPGREGIAAGVRVLDPYPPALERRRGAARRRGERLAELAGQGPEAEVRLRGAIRRDDLLRAGVAAPEETIDGWLVDPDVWQDWRAKLTELADRWAADNPMRPGIPPAEAIRQLGLPDRVVLEALVRADDGLVLDGDGVHRPDVRAVLPPDGRRAVDQLLERLSANAFDVPEPAELAAAAYLDVAVKQGELVRLPGAVYLRPEGLEHAASLLAALGRPFTASEARQALGTTRRIALPVLEELDRRGLTRRETKDLRSMPGGD
ncbi:selenocysteine-specific translation elongation factor [Amycolatopsis acidicola]|uniref:Selenocysteine-specific elongation factor n=1 Tax=Amycolatopsis acidicola TaxID=2596893 RepID=A0A5N0V0A4_9PSEU|nr:selenocysteine-specific translation elongation factor [Amycolatopsis acidicola]KAA9157782.1 selenocysteine-specific translation elongation factor [Amycolatopsis acidicola]